jgi:serine/threonine-protein kinase
MQLYRRDMDSFEVEPIPGTEGAIHPFFSPDGRWVGFLTNDKVKKVSLRGGAPRSLCDASAPMRASWVTDDTILFSQNEGFVLMRVPAEGGDAREVTRLPYAKFDTALPDGRAVLLTSTITGSISGDYQDILLLSLDDLEVKPLLRHGYDARYVPAGHLLFARSGTLLAVEFDLQSRQVLGEPVPVIPGVSMQSLTGGHAQVALSGTGELVYVPGDDEAVGRIAWVDRNGATEFLPVPERAYACVRLSPQGHRLATQVADVNDYIWIYDLDRGTGRRLPTEETSGYPIWTPDGRALTFTSGPAKGPWRLLKQSADGAKAAEELLSEPALIAPQSWSPDGSALGFVRMTPTAVVESSFLLLETNEITGELEPGRMLPQFSPDGRWVADSTFVKTGRFEVWIRSFPDGEIARQVSTDGGMEPFWCANGELFYRQGNSWMATKPTFDPELSWQAPRLVFQTEFIDSWTRSYDVSPDGQRLLVVKRTREPVRTKLHIVHNWFDELKQKMREAEE